MSNLIKRTGMRGFIAWGLIIAMFVFSYGVPIGSGIRTALAADENTVEESNTKKLLLESLLDKNGYLTDDGLLSLATLPFEGEKYIEDEDNGDGTRTMKMYAEPIKYKNDKGELKYIDNSIVAGKIDDNGKKVYRNAGSDVEVLMSEDLGLSNAVEFKYKGYSIAFTPLNILKKDGQSSADLRFLKDNGKAEKDETFDTAKKYGTVEFSNTFNEDADIRVTPTSTGLKEDIILHKIPEETEFSYELTVNKLVPLLRENGDVYFVDLKEELIVAVIASPFMNDSSEEPETCVDIKVELEKIDNKTYKYTLIPDRKYLENAVYPVYIDPTVNTQTGGIIDTWVQSNRSYGYPNSTKIIVGRSSSGTRFRGLVQITDSGLSYIQNEIGNYDVTKVEWYAYEKYVGASSPTTEVYEVAESWTSNVYWGNQPSYYIPRLDYKIVKPVGWYSWDITSLGQGWFDDTKDNNGILIKHDNESLNMYKEYYSDNNSTNKNYFKFTYSDTTPPEDPVVNVSQDVTVNAGALNSGTCTSITIDFANVSDNIGVDYYKLQMDTNPNAVSSTPTLTTTSSTSSFTVTSYDGAALDDNETYYFKVLAYDATGLSSDTAVLNVSTPDRTGPVVNDNTFSIDVAAGNATVSPVISWGYISDNVLTTDIEYKIGSAGTWSKLADYSAGSELISSTEFATDGEYTIYIRAKDEQGNTSVEKTLTYIRDIVNPHVEFVPPTVFGGIISLTPGNNSYQVGVGVSDTNLASWTLDYAEGRNPIEDDFVTIDTGTEQVYSQNPVFWNLTQLTDNTFYTLRMTAIDAAGNSTTDSVYILYAVDTDEVLPEVVLTLKDAQQQKIEIGDQINSESVSVSYSPTEDRTAKLYANGVVVHDEDIDGALSTFNPLAYNSGWTYPEGSFVYLNVVTEDVNGNFDYSYTTYNGHPFDTDFDSLPTNYVLNDTVITSSKVELDTGSTEGSVKSNTQDIYGQVYSITLNTVETTEAGVSSVDYKLYYSEDDYISLTPGVEEQPNIPMKNIKLVAEMKRSSTTDNSPSIDEWYLDIIYVGLEQMTLVHNSFEVNARGFCALDNTFHDPTLESIILIGTDEGQSNTGSVESTTRVTPGDVWEIYLTTTESVDTENGESILYYISTDGGTTWSAENIIPETWTLIENLTGISNGNEIRLKAVLSGVGFNTPKLQEWTLRCRQSIAGEAHEVKLIDEPDNLSALTDANCSTLLRWEASETDGVTYTIYRSEGDAYFDLSDTTKLIGGIEETYYSDYNQTANTTYYYKVVAVKSYETSTGFNDRYSLASNEVKAVTADEDELYKKLGLQSYWSYSGFATGGGTGYINVANGNMVYKTTDMLVTGPFFASVMNRTLNSIGSTTSPIGYGGDYSFNTTLFRETQINAQTLENETVALVLKDGDGSLHRFTGDDTSGYTSAVGTYMELTKETVYNEDTQENELEYQIKRKDGVVYHFDTISLHLKSFTDQNENTLLFNYDIRGNVCEIKNMADETIELTYNVTTDSGMVSTADINPAVNQDIIYENQFVDMLASVIWDNGTESIEYTYEYVECEDNTTRLSEIYVSFSGGLPRIIQRFFYDVDLNGNSIADDNNIIIVDAECRITVVELDNDGKVTNVFDPIVELDINDDVVDIFEDLGTQTKEEVLLDALTNYSTGDHYTLSYLSNETTITDSYDLSVSYEYNENGLVTSTTNAQGSTIDYDYSIGGDYLVDSVTYKKQRDLNCAASYIREVYTYNANDNIEEIKTQSGASVSTLSDLGPKTTFTYHSTFINKVDTMVVDNYRFDYTLTNPTKVGTTITTKHEYEPTNGNLIKTIVAQGSESVYGASNSIEKTTEYEYYTSTTTGVVYKWQLKSVKDHFGKITEYVYDKGRLKDVEEYLGATYVRTLTSYSYDDFYRTDTISELYDKNDETSIPIVTDLEYDSFGRLKLMVNDDNTGEEYTYDDTGRVLTHKVGVMGTSAIVAENTTTYKYDPLGRIESTTLDYGNESVVTSVIYDKWNYDGDSSTGEAGSESDMITTTVAGGTDDERVTVEKYDNLGRLVETGMKDGSTYIKTASYKYDTIGNMIEVEDSAGRVSEAYYDDLGMQTKTIVDPFVYDQFGQIVNGHLNIETLYEYDYLGNTLEVTQRSYAQDSPTTYSDFKIQYVYDDLSRLEKVVQDDPNSTSNLETTYYYDRDASWDGESVVKNYTVDPLGHVNETYIDYLGYKVRSFNSADPTDDDPLNKTGYMETLYDYDPITGWIDKVTRTDGSYEVFDYYSMGQIKTIDYYKSGASTSSQTVEYIYNDLGLVETQKLTDSVTVNTSYFYDKLGRTTSVWEGTIDASGEKDKVIGGLDVVYTYNLVGQIDTITYDSDEDHDLVYTYNGYGQISQIQVDPDGNTDPNVVRTYSYDSITGELVYMQDYRDFDTTTTLTDYIKTDYTYNYAGMVSGITYTDSSFNGGSSRETEDYSYTYDGRGYITSETLTTDYEATSSPTTVYKAYAYDSIGRLIHAVNGDNDAGTTGPTWWTSWDNHTEYAYDQVGNRTDMDVREDQTTNEYDYLYTQFNQLLSYTKDSSAHASYTYDERGNQDEQQIEVDYDGTIKTQTTDYDYNLLNQMTQAVISADGEDTVVSQNTYNVNGQRSIREDFRWDDTNTDGIIDSGEKSGIESTEYFYTGSSILYTYDGSGGLTTENILDPGGQIIASWRERGTSTEESYFYNYDLRGSTTGIVDPETGEAEMLYTYDEFGNMEAAGSFANEVTFTGSVTDLSTGLQYMNARHYNPSTGTFISQDTFTGSAYEPWTQHLYAYTGNNPVNFIDPTGHRAFAVALTDSGHTPDWWEITEYIDILGILDDGGNKYQNTFSQLADEVDNDEHAYWLNILANGNYNTQYAQIDVDPNIQAGMDELLYGKRGTQRKEKVLGLLMSGTLEAIGASTIIYDILEAGSLTEYDKYTIYEGSYDVYVGSFSYGELTPTKPLRQSSKIQGDFMVFAGRGDNNNVFTIINGYSLQETALMDPLGNTLLNEGMMALPVKVMFGYSPDVTPERVYDRF